MRTPSRRAAATGGQGRAGRTPPRRIAVPRGQAMVEYALIVTLLMVGTVVGFVGWPFTRRLFEALQAYVDLFFYALNLAVG